MWLVKHIFLWPSWDTSNKLMDIGRNDPCPCGSGRKYKHCCLHKKESLPVFQKLILLCAVIMIVAAIVSVSKSLTNSESQGSGRVWSKEHQHWHDAPWLAEILLHPPRLSWRSYRGTFFPSLTFHIHPPCISLTGEGWRNYRMLYFRSWHKAEVSRGLIYPIWASALPP